MRGIAIITARGGSKRIPRKNIKDFCGKPIIYYSIQAALASEIFDEVMVSTDDEEIAEISISYGAKVPFLRSAQASDDFAGTETVLKEVIESYKVSGEIFEWMCCVYPTAPFITAERLKECINIFQKNNVNALVPVVKFSFPPQRSLIIQNNNLFYRWPENENERSQDLTPLYHDAGQFYFMKVEEFMKNNSLVMENTVPYIMSDIEVQDIDTVDDWRLAEAKYKIIKGEK